MGSADKARALELGRPLPAAAHERCSGAQLRRGARQRERFELPRAGVVIEVERAHAPPLSFDGSDSINRLRSAALSVAVTSVRPSCTTTTRLSTPYITTR